jgi:hypothetical protein
MFVALANSMRRRSAYTPAELKFHALKYQRSPASIVPISPSRWRAREYLPMFISQRRGCRSTDDKVQVFASPTRLRNRLDRGLPSDAALRPERRVTVGQLPLGVHSDWPSSTVKNIIEWRVIHACAYFLRLQIYSTCIQTIKNLIHGRIIVFRRILLDNDVSNRS